MSSGSEFHKSQFFLWGRVFDFFFFFFIVCFSFFSPPSCQASSTWIELFDLRAAVQEEEEALLLFIQPLPHPAVSMLWAVNALHALSSGSRGKGQVPWPGFS